MRREELSSSRVEDFSFRRRTAAVSQDATADFFQADSWPELRFSDVPGVA